MEVELERLSQADPDHHRCAPARRPHRPVLGGQVGRQAAPWLRRGRGTASRTGGGSGRRAGATAAMRRLESESGGRLRVSHNGLSRVPRTLRSDKPLSPPSSADPLLMQLL